MQFVSHARLVGHRTFQLYVVLRYIEERRTRSRPLSCDRIVTMFLILKMGNRGESLHFIRRVRTHNWCSNVYEMYPSGRGWISRRMNKGNALTFQSSLIGWTSTVTVSPICHVRNEISKRGRRWDHTHEGINTVPLVIYDRYSLVTEYQKNTSSSWCSPGLWKGQSSE
jgi:hypothetical protein